MMRRLFPAAILAVLLCLAASLAAVDFGLELENTSAFQGHDNVLFSQRDTATAWFSATGEDYQVRVEGFYKFLGDFRLDAPGSMVSPYRFDLSDTYLQLQFPDLLGKGSLSMLQVGRFNFADSSTRIINGLSDGLFFRYNYATLELSLQSGFTGLTAQQDANIVLSATDYADYQNPDPNARPYFAPNRIFVGLKAKALELFERHDLAFELFGQFDLRPTDAMHTGYAELSAEGRPLQWFKWRVYAIGELWGDARSSVSMAAGGRAQLSFPALLGLVAVANVDWASGSELPFRQFGPLYQGQVAQIYPLVFADSLTFSLNAAVRPASGLMVGATGYALLRASANAPTDPAFPAGATSPYLGTEADLNIDWTVSSEFKVGLKGGAFFPNTAADAYGPAALPRWLGSFQARLTF
jgi:hypothetical protein